MAQMLLLFLSFLYIAQADPHVSTASGCASDGRCIEEVGLSLLQASATLVTKTDGHADGFDVHMHGRSKSKKHHEAGARARSRQTTKNCHDIEQVTERMKWWQGEKSDQAEHPTPLVSKDDAKYLLFDIDCGGLNNIRIGWENAALIAFHTGRTLVLPHARPWYLIDNGPQNPNTGSTSLMENFLNLPQMRRGLPVLTFNEFAAKEFPTLKDLPKNDRDYAAFATTNTTVVPAACDLSKYKIEDKFMYVHDVEENKDEDIPMARLFVCSRWKELGQPAFKMNGKPAGYPSWPLPASYTSLLQNHFVWHPEVFQLASQVVSKLGLFNYVAVHARYNDFQFKDKRESPQRIADTWTEQFEKWLGDGDTIYISTDGTNPAAFLKPFNENAKRPLKVVLGTDIFEKPDSPIAELISKMPSGRLQQIKGPIEQVICTFAKVFVGTADSTFSGYIEKMRENADAPHHVSAQHQHAPPGDIQSRDRLVHTRKPTADQLQSVELMLSQAKSI